VCIFVTKDLTLLAGVGSFYLQLIYCYYCCGVCLVAVLPDWWHNVGWEQSICSVLCEINVEKVHLRWGYLWPELPTW